VTVRCATFGVTQVLVGLFRVGVVNLGPALEEIDQSGLSEREAVVDRLLDILAPDNFIRDRDDAQFRKALWREYLRHKGEDFREFYSDVEVVVRAEAGDERDALVELTRSVFAEYELEPLFSYAPPDEEGPSPHLLVGDHTIVRGASNRKHLKSAVHKSFADW
jgi:hypothetical protein